MSKKRRAVINRTACFWDKYIIRLVALGGRHDILPLSESTTSAPERAALRGTRTRDGRFWDHVRGLGGLHAATGVESLDRAAELGFNTLAHELAHQVHIFTMTRREKDEIERLYRSALAMGRCLDYYAATCVEEYFAQGVESFVSFAKRADCRRTYGHTRFELIRLDPKLERFIRKHASRDPLAGPKGMELLEACADHALLSGRFEDVLTISELMGKRATPHCLDLAKEAERQLPFLEGPGL